MNLTCSLDSALRGLDLVINQVHRHGHFKFQAENKAFLLQVSIPRLSLVLLHVVQWNLDVKRVFLEIQ